MPPLVLLLALWHCSYYFVDCRETVEVGGEKYLGLRSASHVVVGEKEEGLEEGRIRSERVEVQVGERIRCLTSCSSCFVVQWVSGLELG